jgi:hypothetical protein
MGRLSRTPAIGVTRQATKFTITYRAITGIKIALLPQATPPTGSGDPFLATDRRRSSWPKR